ncbi:calponin homology domain-containing protein, partial [Blyttiomyces helicus]
RIHRLVNVDSALRFLRDKLRDPLANIGSEDIVDGNFKLTLGLVWVLILRFRIEQIGGETEVGDGGGKITLLAWCRTTLQPYVSSGLLPAPIENFSEAWQTGVAFLCLVHVFDPYLVPEISSVLEAGAPPTWTPTGLFAPDEHVVGSTLLARSLRSREPRDWRATLVRAFALVEKHMGVPQVRTGGWSG